MYRKFTFYFINVMALIRFYYVKLLFLCNFHPFQKKKKKKEKWNYGKMLDMLMMRKIYRFLQGSLNVSASKEIEFSTIETLL